MEKIVRPGFEGIASAFGSVAAGRPGWSGAVCVIVEGTTVVDLWTDAADHDALYPVHSCTKGVGAGAIALLVSRGLLDPDAPVASYWPEFAAGGKAEVTVGQLMSHQAGLTSVDGGFDLAAVLEHTDLARKLADQVPYWVPGSRHGYHALTIGVLMRELVLRTDGRTTKELYDAEMRMPYDIDFTIGCPVSSRGRIRRFRESAVAPPTAEEMEAVASNPLFVPAFGDEPLDLNMPLRAEVMDGDLLAAGGVASARGLATYYAALTTGLDGRPPLLDRASIDRCSEPRAVGPDAILPVETGFGLGFMVPCERMPFAGTTSFGHDGAGGALGFATPTLHLALGWTTDTAHSQGADPAALSIASAIEELLR
jgi:CubicO group peptidase (beta-lactamase class C family)